MDIVIEHWQGIVLALCAGGIGLFLHDLWAQKADEPDEHETAWNISYDE